MPTQQQNQRENAAVRSAPDQQRGNLVTRVLSACVRMWVPNLEVSLCPPTPALADGDQLPRPSSGPPESSSSPLRREEKERDQVAAENLQQEERHILPRPPPIFSTQGTGPKSKPKRQSVENSVARKTSIASEVSSSPTRQGTAARDQLFPMAGGSKKNEEFGKAGAGSTSVTDGNHYKRFASPASSGKFPAPDGLIGVAANVATENPYCATAESTLETCQKCRPIWMSPDELDVLASMDESGGVPTRMEAKVDQEVPRRPSSPRVRIETTSRFSSTGSSKSAAAPNPEAPTKEEALPKKIPREHGVAASHETVTRETGTTLAEKARMTGNKAKNPDDVRDLMLGRITEMFAGRSAECRPSTEDGKGEGTPTFVSRMVNVFADEREQEHGSVWDTSFRLPDEQSLPSDRPASLKLGESDAIAEAAGATAAAVMETYDSLSPKSGEKPGDAIEKKMRKPPDMGRVEQTRPKWKEDEVSEAHGRAVVSSEKSRTAYLGGVNATAAASRASTSRACPDNLKQHSSKHRTKLEGEYFSGAPQGQQPGAEKASAPSSGSVADDRHSAAGPAAAAVPSAAPAAPRLCTLGASPISAARATTPVPAAISTPTAVASSAKAQHQPVVASATQEAATASSSSSGTIRLQPFTENSEGWKWPTAAALVAASSEHNLGGKAGGGAEVSAVLKVDKPRFESFKWIGRASTPKANLPWGSWRRKRDPEAWEKMVSAAILNSAIRQGRRKHSA